MNFPTDSLPVQVVGYDPEDEKRRESLFSLGNGLLLLRAAMPWFTAGDHHYPGMYHAGCYNPLASKIQGKTVWNESIVNLPNGLSLTFRMEDGAWFSIEAVEILHYEQILDLRAGLMRRSVQFRENLGRITSIEEERFVSMDAPNLVGLRLAVTPKNWSGTITFRSQIDGSVVNNNIKKHADYAHEHLQLMAKGAERKELFLNARTINSHFNVSVRTKLLTSPRMEEIEVVDDSHSIRRIFKLQAEAGRPIKADKIMAVFVDKADVLDVAASAAGALAGVKDYEALRERHCAAWTKIWGAMPFLMADKKIEQAQQLTLFHLLQNYSPHSLGRDVSLPARGWQEGYRGHIFWDEMFSVPLLSVRYPELARELLLYRYARLDAAKENARKHGLRGALYPWRSARTGDEETPRFQKNPVNGHWREDHTERQVHINVSIVWDIFHYAWATGDQAFFNEQGLEMLVEISRMWASLAALDPQDGRYNIRCIVGPDEFHTNYAGRKEPGIDNNSYTNLMAAWTLQQVLEALNAAPRVLRDRFNVSEDESLFWDQISRYLRVSFSPSGIISQFEHVEELEQIDPDSVSEGSADWTLEEQGKDVNDYQLFKQADVAMLLYLFGVDELQALFDRLGYTVTADQLHQTVEYYRGRTSHGSSLSQVSYAAALLPFDRHLSWSEWRKALAPDLDAKNAHSTAEGLHLGSMAAALDVLQRHYLGLSFRANGLHLLPAIPEGLPPTRFSFRFRQDLFELHWNGAGLQLSSHEANAATICVHCRGAALELAPGQRATIPLIG